MTYTRWHQDDPRGRIEKLMRANPHFPRFEFIEFDAEADENAPDDSPQHWLFPERFSPASYLETRATMGAYDWAALYRQRPRAKEGNLFKVDRIRIIQQEQLPANLRWQWGWDIAGTEKQINKSDPDYTVGIKAAVQDGCVYIARMIRGQWSAEQRLQIMEQVGKADGPAVPHAYEVVALGVDAYNIIAKRLRRSGIVVRKFTPSGKGDKVVRSTPLQSVCELGQLFLVAAGWNDTLIDEFAAFPTGGTHDDIIDAAVTATYDELQERRRVGLEPVF
jgi:predicted phage terminase large subunit-like protein